jgi:hypothetical protein
METDMHGNIIIIARSAFRAGALARAGYALLAAALIAAMFSGSAAAQSAATSRQAVHQACANDVRTLCAGVFPGGGRIRQCIIEKRDQLSDGCKSAMLAARNFSGR